MIRRRLAGAGHCTPRPGQRHPGLQGVERETAQPTRRRIGRGKLV